MIIGLARRAGVQRLLVGGLVLLGTGMFWGGCHGPYLNLTCAKYAHCHEWPNDAPGTICVDNRCICEKVGECLCIGRRSPETEWGCRPQNQCEIGTLCDGIEIVDEDGTGGSASGSSTGSGIVIPGCASEAECPEPPDAKCGKATCVDGVCGLDLVAQPGELKPLSSQIRGDCKTVVCDGTGHSLTISDPSDLYNDVRVCTVDICGSDGPMNLNLEDASPCPGGGSGWCFDGRCVVCIEEAINSFLSDCGPGQVCNVDNCYSIVCQGKCGNNCSPCPAGYSCTLPTDCKDGVCGPNGMCALPTCDDLQPNGGETDVDCGGPCSKRCLDGQGCAVMADCESGVCWAGVCQAPACNDGLQNGDETATDCGGSCGTCL